MSALLALLSGGFVGFSLGLIGGGGSILATPLLLYVVGVGQPHVAIGTGALAVAVSAFANFTGHWRAGNVRWGNALVFAAFGVVGALVGSTLGKAFDGERLLFLFALVMIAVGLLMLRSGTRNRSGNAAAGEAVAPPAFTPKLAAVALAVGVMSGFFGIGGGFLIVPGLVFATGMPMINAIGTSLFAVGAFGVATAANYALSGMIDWPVAAEYIAGGLVGGWIGMRLACRLAGEKGTLDKIFASLIFAVAAYMLYRTSSAWT
ncbi:MULTISPECIES: sulfite exporter TauE/SafE family protein [Methylobacteriaceae]|uniref:Probable membrane transporter protein n=2 Tax=Methylobacterium TaxID=407 RepID=A0ABQ4SU81_9HYPH|nr:MULTISPECIES: sulfite exporter TauE/SafE family protein [Methylobacterium]PIU05432.1 MAG: hypothetical protein COT56_14855 [Methylobacterium sp. CG09_land_8_20_14_0_10_71_15]PIU12983.1 MAG: hypothetical protein COT28_12945 [Methylobacterium sp. CG08_land_8_20_14_0_20_71_15]GJE05334.1 putative membrane transporter protein [Methylobacterium jeotgali]